MTPRRTLHVHMGAHRTATSSLQRFLFQNSGALARQGFCYPHLHPYTSERHDGLANGLRSGRISVEKAAEILEGAADRAGDGVHSVIISDEDICEWPDLRPIARLGEYFDVRVVYVMRRQDTWLESWYLQNIKWQWQPRYSHVTLGQFLDLREDFHWIHYDRLLQRVDEAFGVGAVTPLVMERRWMPDGPLAALCNSMGVVVDDSFTTPPSVNQRFSPEISEFMRQLPLGDIRPPTRALMEEAIRRAGDERASTSGTELLIPYQDRMQLLAEYAPGNRAVAQRFFDRDELFTDPLPTADTPVTDMQLPPDTPDVLAQFVSPMMLHLAVLFEEEVGRAFKVDYSKARPPRVRPQSATQTRRGRLRARAQYWRRRAAGVTK